MTLAKRRQHILNMLYEMFYRNFYRLILYEMA